MGTGLECPPGVVAGVAGVGLGSVGAGEVCASASAGKNKQKIILRAIVGRFVTYLFQSAVLFFPNSS